MDTFLFWFLSILEYFAIFFFMFRLFTFRVKEYIAEIIFSSIILTFVSDALRNAFDLGFIDPLVQLLLFCALLWQVFKVHFFYSIIMAVAMVFYNASQALIVSILTVLDIYRFPLSQNEIWMLQLITVFLVMMLALFIQQRNWRFSFVPTDASMKVKYSGDNLTLLIIIVLQFIITALLYVSYLLSLELVYIIGALLVLGILMVYLRYINKKEIEQ